MFVACTEHGFPVTNSMEENFVLISWREHRIKNAESSRYKRLLQIGSDRRFLLTGTPINNNLPELLVLLQFLMPGSLHLCVCDHVLQICVYTVVNERHVGADVLPALCLERFLSAKDALNRFPHASSFSRSFQQ